jgi:1-acyl-sn-glycerol-3-phosphate acyltransferase
MRTLLVLLIAALYTFTLGPVVLIAGMLGVEEKPGGLYYRCMHAWARAICRAAGVRIIVHDQARMSDRDGVVYISNHVSWFDVFALAATLPRYSFVAKSELRRIPMFGRAAETVGIVFLERGNKKQAFDSYKLAAEQVRLGRSIVVCPEGTRGPDYHLRPFKKGPFVLAIASQSPIVPTIVYGSREVMPRGSFRITRGEIHLHFLEPIPTAGLHYDHRGALTKQVWNRMAGAIHELYGVGTVEHPIATENERVV